MSINNFYPLLYVPLLGLIGLCLLGGWKLVKERRQHSRETWLKMGGAIIGIALFAASYAVMVITHGRAHDVAFPLFMGVALVNLLRTKLLSPAEAAPDE